MRRSAVLGALFLAIGACGPSAGSGVHAPTGLAAPDAPDNVPVQIARFTRPEIAAFSSEPARDDGDDTDIVAGTIEQIWRVTRPCETVLRLVVSAEMWIRAEEMPPSVDVLVSIPAPAAAPNTPPRAAGPLHPRDALKPCVAGKTPSWSAQASATLAVGQRFVWHLGANYRVPLNEDPIRGSSYSAASVIAIHAVDEIPALVARRGPLITDVPLAPWPDTQTPYCLSADGKRDTCPPPLRQDGSRNTRLADIHFSGETAVDELSGLQWQKDHSAAPLGRVRAAAYCRDLVLAGHDDWRLPRFHELMGIIDHGRTGPALLSVFDGPKQGILWTATLDAGVPWVMTVEDGTIHSTHYDDPGPDGRYFARCVRSAKGASLRAAPPMNRFVKRDHLLVDTLLDIAFAPSLSPTPVSWTGAVRFCDDLSLHGHDDYRVPTLREVLGLASWMDPSPDTAVCDDGGPIAWPDTTDDLLWTATPRRDVEGSVFVVNGFCGAGHWSESITEPGWTGKMPEHHTLCVRDLRTPPLAAPPTDAKNGAAIVAYPSGHPFSEGASRDGKKEGLWTYHHDMGPVWFRVTYDHGAPAGEERPADLHNGQVRTLDDGSTTTITYASGVAHGPAEGAYPSGNKRFTGAYLNGLPDGPWVFYHPSGHVAERRTYVAGRLEGKVESFYDDGKPAGRIAYEKGLRHGRHERFHPSGALAEDGQLDHGTGTIKAYFPKGSIAREESYKGDVQEGAWVWYHENGARQSLTSFKDGQFHGPQREWNEAGLLVRERMFEQDKQVGTERSWHANGTLASEVPYADGLEEGLSRRWDEGGLLVEEGQLRKGLYEGVVRFYVQGRLAIESTYSNGVEIEDRRLFPVEPPRSK